MFYATGGVAWANIEYAARQADTLPGFFLTTTSVTSFTQTKTGWVAGGGAEWMATTNILLRAEYLYYNINAATNGSAVIDPKFSVSVFWGGRSTTVGPTITYTSSGLRLATSSELRRP